jgi:hypothetical protein
MKLLAAYSATKALDDPATPNEDAEGVSGDGLTAALSDGASESYDAATWSQILVDAFIERPRFNPNWLDGAIQRYERDVTMENLPWYAEAALERGSFATLLGACHKPHRRRVVVFAIGDSIAVLADGDRFVRSFPYEEAEQFRNNPRLLSTQRNKNVWIQQGFAPKKSCTIWRFDTLSRPRFLMMTDAVGAWLLAEPWTRLPPLLSIANGEEFDAALIRWRESDGMRQDDSTLLIFSEGEES